MSRLGALLMLVLLALPHVPQVGLGADASPADCGAAAAAMLIRAYRPADTTPVDALYVEANRDGQLGLSLFGELLPLLEAHGVPAQFWRNLTPARQAAFIRERRPYITALRRGALWHAVVVVGWDGERVWLHDPLDSAGPRPVPLDEFLAAQGPLRMALVPRDPLPPAGKEQSHDGNAGRFDE